MRLHAYSHDRSLRSVAQRAAITTLLLVLGTSCSSKSEPGAATSDPQPALAATAGKATVPELLDDLTSADFARAVDADETLAQQGEAAIPLLVEALADASPMRRIAAGHALEQLGPKAVPALVGALTNGPDAARRAALESLVRMGSDAADAAPALVQTLRANDPHLRAGATYALASMKDAPGVSADDVMPLLDDPIAVVRWQAIVTLIHLNAESAEFRGKLPQFAEKDPNAAVRLTAQQALDHLQSKNRPSGKE